MRECSALPEIKIRTSSPSTTKCIPIDDDDMALPTHPPRTAKPIPGLHASPSQKTIRGAHTDESEVDDTYATDSSRSNSTYSPEIITQVNYSSAPRRARTNRQRVRRHHPYSPPGDASPPEVQPGPMEIPTCLLSSISLPRSRRKGRPVRSCIA